VDKVEHPNDEPRKENFHDKNKEQVEDHNVQLKALGFCKSGESIKEYRVKPEYCSNRQLNTDVRLTPETLNNP
jgi:hypothetical protein